MIFYFKNHDELIKALICYIDIHQPDQKEAYETEINRVKLISSNPSFERVKRQFIELEILEYDELKNLDINCLLVLGALEKKDYHDQLEAALDNKGWNKPPLLPQGEIVAPPFILRGTHPWYFSQARPIVTHKITRWIDLFDMAQFIF